MKHILFLMEILNSIFEVYKWRQNVAVSEHIFKDRGLNGNLWSNKGHVEVTGGGAQLVSLCSLQILCPGKQGPMTPRCYALTTHILVDLEEVEEAVGSGTRIEIIE